MSDTAIHPSGETPEQYPLPPASFEILVISLKTQSEMQLGLLQFDENERAEPDLRLARHTIDMLAMIQEKTRGNLSMDEQRLIDNSLTELRFRYIQATGETKKPKAEEQANG